MTERVLQRNAGNDVSLALFYSLDGSEDTNMYYEESGEVEKQG